MWPNHFSLVFQFLALMTRFMLQIVRVRGTLVYAAETTDADAANDAGTYGSSRDSLTRVAGRCTCIHKRLTVKAYVQDIAAKQNSF